jgi:hypothetical protein
MLRPSSSALHSGADTISPFDAAIHSPHSHFCFTFSHQNMTVTNYKRILHSLDIPIRQIPGATPKKPFSGLIALSCPLLSNFIHAMSSPTHSTLYPGSDGHIIARFVLPHALGNAAAIYLLCPAGFVMPRICEYKSHEYTIQQTPKKQIIYTLAYESFFSYLCLLP